jgi:hypothetical protein
MMQGRLVAGLVKPDQAKHVMGLRAPRAMTRRLSSLKKCRAERFCRIRVAKEEVRLGPIPEGGFRVESVEGCPRFTNVPLSELDDPKQEADGVRRSGTCGNHVPQ